LLIRVLGEGGMARVYEATDRDLGRRVAIKTLHEHRALSPDVRLRFLREGQTASKIRHPHVVDIYDVGRGNQPYLVMEYLEGEDLANCLLRQKLLSVELTADLLLPVVAAVAAAHDLGVIHRDLKPDNIFLSVEHGSIKPKVLDFGISKIAAAGAEAAMTKTSAVMGSPLYMSPEQMTASRQVDARTDIWAMGVVLYELLTARVPFSAETLPEICGLILTATPQAIRDFSPAVPDGLQTVVRRCLEKDRERRFANVSELSRALSPFGSRATSRSVERIARILGASSMLDSMPPSGPAPLPANFGPSTQSNWGQTRPSRSSTVPVIAALGVGVVLLGAVAAFLLLRSKPEGPQLAGRPPVSSEASPTAAPTAAPLAVVTAAALPAADSAVVPTTKASAAPAPAAPPAKPSIAPNPVKVSPPPKPAAKPAVVSTPVPVPQPAPAPVKAKRSTDDLLSGRN